MIIHGIIHLIGFAKAYGVGGIDQFSENIPKTLGLLWLTTSIMFIASAVLILLNTWWWLPLTLFSVTVSQILILRFWLDAKTGTIVNILLVVAILIHYNLK